MATFSLIFNSVQIGICILTIIFALIYLIAVLFLQHIRRHISTLTINLCLAIISCALFWMTYYILGEHNFRQFYTDNICIILLYIQMLCTLQVPLAFIIVSMHRLCSIVYHTKAFFKSKRWLVICVMGQWLSGFILSLPMFLNYSSCTTPSWKRIYMLVIIVIIPVLLCITINSLIISYVRASARRIHAVRIVTQFSKNTTCQQSRISRRDIRLVEYMAFMFVTFIIGWSPVYIYSVMLNYMTINAIVPRVLSALAQISLLSNALNLFLHDPKLRQYLKNMICKCF